MDTSFGINTIGTDSVLQHQPTSVNSNPDEACKINPFTVIVNLWVIYLYMALKQTGKLMKVSPTVKHVRLFLKIKKT